MMWANLGGLLEYLHRLTFVGWGPTSNKSGLSN